MVKKIKKILIFLPFYIKMTIESVGEQSKFYKKNTFNAI